MANGVYNKFLAALAAGSIDLTSGTFKMVLCDSATYTADLTDSGDEFLSDISGGARLTTGTLTTTFGVLASRVFDASDFTGTFPDPGGGATGEILVIYKDTGVEATSPLLFYYDTITGLPMTLDGTDDTVQFNASGIWKLGA